MQPSDTRREVGGLDFGVRDVLTGVLGAPIAWTLHLFVSYFLVTVTCATGWGGGDAAVIIATLVLGAAAALSTALAFRRWRGLGRDEDWGTALSEPGGRGGFLWLVGVLLGGIFTLAIVLAGIAPLFVPTCGPSISPGS